MRHGQKLLGLISLKEMKPVTLSCQQVSRSAPIVDQQVKNLSSIHEDVVHPWPFSVG